MATTITLKPKGSMNLIKVNGRVVDYARRIERIKKISDGWWEGIANGEPFEITGGKAAGGAANEWYLTWPPAYGDLPIYLSSAADCIRAIEKI